MKNQIRKTLTIIGTAVTLCLFVVSCGDDANPTKECQTYDPGCGSSDVEVCCTATKCYYESNGKRYDCDGTNCNDAAADLIADICDFSTVEELENILRASGQLSEKF